MKHIQELMQKAGTDSSGKWMSVDNAKTFAKLIVQECVGKLENDGMVEVAIELKEHFNIEKL